MLEMLKRGGINHQTVQQNKVKLQGGHTGSKGGGGKCKNFRDLTVCTYVVETVHHPICHLRVRELHMDSN